MRIKTQDSIEDPMCCCGPTQVVELSSREMQALASYGSKVAAWGWELQQRPAPDGSSTGSANSCMTLAGLPLVCGVQLNSMELKVGSGSLEVPTRRLLLIWL
jgi:hypothetical protein